MRTSEGYPILDTWPATSGNELDARRVSKRHACIQVSDKGVILRDLNSTNGTFINGEKVTEAVLKPGQTLRLGFVRSGVRAYLAVAGGFRASSVLGSVACQVREGLGGLSGDGRALRAGDRLACRSASLPGPASVPWPYVPDYRRHALLRVIVGGDAVDFEEDELQGFFARDWQVAQADRMGVRLAGEALRAPGRQCSLGVADGAIQVPPDGQPIVLMADRQTIGGYPLLGWLHPLDRWRLAQCPARHRLRFTPVSLGDAQAELREFYRFFGRA